ncbi:hypothetical protein GCM10010512_11850 [Streptomyces thermoviolaceus subsp. thermoviolaceus]|nr:hypothetical protein GCM10010512_11850 [Streptomyces thermoviolaceus subsp. thermoviolaceus]
MPTDGRESHATVTRPSRVLLPNARSLLIVLVGCVGRDGRGGGDRARRGEGVTTERARGRGGACPDRGEGAVQAGASRYGARDVLRRTVGGSAPGPGATRSRRVV